MTPEAAAEWMAQRVSETGGLGQREAAFHLLRFNNAKLAYVNDEDQTCVGRHVLRRLRRGYPGLRYDRRLKMWRESFP
jgi:hypothetical protein